MGNELEKLFAEKMPVIYKYLVKIGCSHADAEDIVQSTFLKAFVYLDAIDAEKISSWLFKVALYQYYDLCRKQKLPLAYYVEVLSIICRQKITPGRLCFGQ